MSGPWWLPFPQHRRALEYLLRKHGRDAVEQAINDFYAGSE